MACIERRPVCGGGSDDIVPEPLTEIGSVIGVIATVAGAAGGVLKALEVIGGALGAGAGGAISGTVAAVGVIIITGLYLHDRCTSEDGLSECLAGVVHDIVQDFSTTIEDIFPFVAMHDRVDVVVKSRYWGVVEDGGAKVFCTDEAPPRRSEIMRCYYRTKRVCDAITGAVVGAGIGGAAGIVAAAAVAAAIGCATVILCIIALLVAALVAALAALIGALIGGHIGKAASDDSSPAADSGSTIAIGDLITVKGNMVKREFDEKANVLWWVESSSLSGRAPDTIPNSPFSYCEIDDTFTMDGCPVIIT